MRTIYKALVGSQAYGTATPESDHDYKGIYVQPLMDILTYNYKPQIEFSKDHTEYEVRRFLELARTANPTILELLFMPKENIVKTSPEFEFIRKYRYEFLTKKCLNSFAGYARQQIKKASGLEKKGNWEKRRIERKTPIDFCYISKGIEGSMAVIKYLESPLFKSMINKEGTIGLIDLPNMPQNYMLMLSNNPDIQLRGICNEDSNTVIVSSLPKDYISNRVYPIGTIHFNLNAYQVHCKEYKEYQTWLKERNVARYVDFDKHGQMIDGKNMLHCTRLIDVAEEIATQSELIVKRPNAEYLISIRKGEVNLKDILARCEEKIQGLDLLYANSKLPDDVDPDLCDFILREIRERQINDDNY